MSAMTKVCTKCGEEKGLSEFEPNKQCKFGVNSQCRVCRRAYKRDRHADRWQNDPEYRDKKNAANISRWHNDPQFRDAQRQRRDARMERAEYRERTLAYYRAWRAEKMMGDEYRESERERSRERRSTPEWRAWHTEYMRLWKAKRRENEEFDAFMARMEQEAAEWEANQADQISTTEEEI